MIIRNTRAYLHHMPIETEMRYDPRKPAEVFFTFDRTKWIFARDLLVRGMTERIGEGDIAICPSGVRHVEVYLESPTGKCRISMSRAEVSRFLEETLRLMPDEEEEGIIMREMDRWIERLFRISD